MCYFFAGQVNGQSLYNVTYEEAKEMLKQSNLSLTVLKPSVSTTSSHRSLSNNNETIKHHSSELTMLDKSFSNNNNSGEPSAISASSVTVTGSSLQPALSMHMHHHHYRSPSAPIHSYSDQMISLHSPEQHIKSTSVINRMSDDDIRKMLTELQEEQRRRTQLDIIAEGKPHRTDSFMSAVKIGPGNVTAGSGGGGSSFAPIDFLSNHQRIPRPVSTNSSKASVTSSSGSTGRYDGIMPSSPLNNISRSDPLALDKARQFGLGGSSATNSNTSVNSTRIKKPTISSVITKSYINSPYQKTSILDHSLTWGPSSHHNISSNINNSGDVFPPMSNQSSSLGNHYSNNSNHSLSNHRSSSLGNHYSGGGSKHVTSASPHTVDFSSDRYTSHSSMNTSKQGSTRSVGQSFNNSSHGSLTSESIDKVTSNNLLFNVVEPVTPTKEEESIVEPTLSAHSSTTEHGRNSSLIRPSSSSASRSSSTKQKSSMSIDGHIGLTIDSAPITVDHSSMTIQSPLTPFVAPPQHSERTLSK